MSKIPMNFRLEETLVEQLKKIADHENRSLTNLIETELKRIAENHSIIEQGKEKEKMNFGITANGSGIAEGGDYLHNSPSEA